MRLKLLRSKIHQATITESDVNYVGSITIDADLLDAAGMFANEVVLVADLRNGSRFETYVIAGERGSGVICINGAAAHLVEVGDQVIIFAHALLKQKDIRDHEAVVVLCNDQNKIDNILHYPSTLETSIEDRNNVAD